jgi:hypothetical protein
VKEQLRYRPLLTTEQLSLEVVQDLQIASLEPATLIDSILRYNQEHDLLDTLRQRSFNWKAPQPATSAKEKLALAKAEAFAKRLQSG